MKYLCLEKFLKSGDRLHIYFGSEDYFESFYIALEDKNRKEKCYHKCNSVDSLCAKFEQVFSKSNFNVKDLENLSNIADLLKQSDWEIYINYSLDDDSFNLTFNYSGLDSIKMVADSIDSILVQADVMANYLINGHNTII